MKLRNLLLGSAAALLPSTAFAADAIIVEPEPVEYVRVCDLYGDGYYYIPGTETCLRISGYARFQVGFSGDDDQDPIDVGAGTFVPGDIGYYGFADDAYTAAYRARLNFDARSETELGTLRSFIRIQGDGAGAGANADADVEVEYAYISLGGAIMGYTQSFYYQPHAFESGFNAHTDGELSLGQNDVTLVGYTFKLGGLGLGVSVENDGTDDYQPNFVAVAEYAFSFASVYGAFAYADDRNPDQPGLFDAFDTTDEGIAAKVGFDSDFNGIGLRGGYLYADSDNIYAPGGGFASGSLDDDEATPLVSGAEHSVWLSASAGFGDFAVALAGQYLFNLYQPGSDETTDLDAYQVELNVGYEIVENLDALVGVAYRDFTSSDDLFDDDDDFDLDGQVEGFVRFTRSF